LFRGNVCKQQLRGTIPHTESFSGSGYTLAIVPDKLPPQLEMTMDKDRIAGSAKQAKGAVKEAVGKITGDKKTQAEGRAEKVAGKVQNAVGGAKDAVREAVDGRKR
jgi:uncharacterized protein YjbJ (UPF0337 family)